MATRRRSDNPLFNVLRENASRFDPNALVQLFQSTDERRVRELASALARYISDNVPAAFERRQGLSDYRTNPYVLMTSASVLGLNRPRDFGKFLHDSKFYMALETSFGKSIEAAFVSPYPIRGDQKWEDPVEKLAEFAALEGLSREEKARRRVSSVWREIDKSVVVKNRRYLVTIKSGPNTINDTQVQGMVDAISGNYQKWADATRHANPRITNLDIVIGLTYGTDQTTNNKENQILAKLFEFGFVEEDRARAPGILIDSATRTIRIYRCIGKDFWAFIGQPDSPRTAGHVFLEILLGLAKALSSANIDGSIEDRLNHKLDQLQRALGELRFPRAVLPKWIEQEFSEDELFWFATAMTAFFDDGI